MDDFLTDLKKAGKGLPGLVTSGETTLSDVDKTSKAAQKSWLLRKNVPQSQGAHHPDGCRSGKGLIVPGYGRWLLVLCLVAWGCASAPTKENLQSQAVSLNDQGYQYYRQSRFNVAEAKFAEALKLNRLIDRRVGIAANLNNLGVIAQEQDNPKQALVYFQEALEINRELHDPAGLSETLNNLGLVQLSQGRVTEAQTAYLEALDQARLLPPGPLLALSLTHLGDVARVRRDYDLALNYYHQALRVDEDRKDARGRALRWERLGRTFLDLKDYARADLYLRDALRDFRRLEDTDGLADTLQGPDPAGPGPGG